ncbi:Spo16p [Saccharomyces eubayanus]|uniref:Spo16p n=1 Tax=Saccharomyces eubayanus TaxID=1080349 RepID=UPI0006C00E76|nr:SPO16-like protein [Saccharomyces eubayanus]KOG99213.1 SPO16-like protein [Saccharomyces eubayanus]
MDNSEFLWKVLRIQELRNVNEHFLVNCITVDTSRLVSQVDKLLKAGDNGVDFIVQQLQLLIKDVYRQLRRSQGMVPEPSLAVNLNFTILKFSVAYWDILLQRSLDLMPEVPRRDVRYFITEVTSVERIRYVETNQNFKTFKNHQGLVRDSVEMDEFIDYETLIKQIIFDLFRRNGVQEQDFEALLLRFHDLESLMIAFNE